MKTTDTQRLFAAVMAQHYTEALFFTDSGDLGDPVEEGAELLPSAAQQIGLDCLLFARVAWPLLTAPDAETGNSWTASQAGHDFWLTRNGHGAGFWDREGLPFGEELTALCAVFGEQHPYMARPGKVGLDVPGDLPLNFRFVPPEQFPCLMALFLNAGIQLTVPPTETGVPTGILVHRQQGGGVI